MKKYIKSNSQYVDYDPNQGWTSEDIQLHKSIDWQARNYMPYLVDDDSFVGEVVGYSTEGEDIKSVKFVKELSANPIYGPRYVPKDKQPFGNQYVGPMFDGDYHNNCIVCNRYDTYELYDMLSR